MHIQKRVPSTVLYAKKGEVQAHVDAGLKEKFGNAALRAAVDIYSNEDLAPTYTVDVSDLDNPDAFVGKDILDYVRGRVEEVVPDSRPFVRAKRFPYKGW